MKILVTGGAGYLGSVLVESLLDAGHSVIVLDPLAYGQLSLLPLATRKELTFERGDARDRRRLRPLVRAADVLIPLAALVGAPACDRQPRLAEELNLDAVRTLLDLRSADQPILFPNTNSGYGARPDAICTEATEFAPVSLYGRTKAAAERLLLDAGGAVSFRLATAFGTSPRMRFDLLVNDFVRRAVGERVLVLFESGFRRNFVHVRDIAAAFLFALDHWQDMRDGVFNVGLSDANLTKRQLAERIRGHIPDLTILESDIGRDPDRRDYEVSNVKIEALGWRPGRSLDDGIRELIVACSMLPRSPLGNA
ncbi:MAG: NAD(P)-dependent oxidoreductase [Acidobacteriota bacterium]